MKALLRLLQFLVVGPVVLALCLFGPFLIVIGISMIGNWGWLTGASPFAMIFFGLLLVWLGLATILFLAVIFGIDD